LQLEAGDLLSSSVDPHPASEAAGRLNPATVAALLEITWRTVEAESASREGINSKATSLASFASIVLSLTATLGGEFLRLEDRWQLALYLVSLLALVSSLAVAVWALLPRKRRVLGATYLARFPTWSEIVKAPEEVQGEAMRGLIDGCERDRELNHRNAQRVFAGFILLAVGLFAVALEAMIVAINGSA
jgi:hypothetical protein